MALGTTRNIKRQWSLHTQNDAAIEPFERVLYEEFNALATAVQAFLGADAVLTSAALAIGSTTHAAAHAVLNVRIGGTSYTKAANSTGITLGNDVVPQSTYGAVALDLGIDGTVDATEATANATGYVSAALAAAGLPAVAANHIRVGYVTATKSDGAFTFGSTALNAANTTVAYTNTTPLAVDMSTVSLLSTIESGD